MSILMQFFVMENYYNDSFHLPMCAKTSSSSKQLTDLNHILGVISGSLDLMDIHFSIFPCWLKTSTAEMKSLDVFMQRGVGMVASDVLKIALQFFHLKILHPCKWHGPLSCPSFIHLFLSVSVLHSSLCGSNPLFGSFLHSYLEFLPGQPFCQNPLNTHMTKPLACPLAACQLTPTGYAVVGIKDIIREVYHQSTSLPNSSVHNQSQERKVLDVIPRRATDKELLFYLPACYLPATCLSFGASHTLLQQSSIGAHVSLNQLKVSL